MGGEAEVSRDSCVERPSALEEEGEDARAEPAAASARAWPRSWPESCVSP